MTTDCREREVFTNVRGYAKNSQQRRRRVTPRLLTGAAPIPSETQRHRPMLSVSFTKSRATTEGPWFVFNAEGKTVAKGFWSRRSAEVYAFGLMFPGARKAGAVH